MSFPSIHVDLEQRLSDILKTYDEPVYVQKTHCHILDSMLYLIRPIKNMVCMSTPKYYPYVYKYRLRLEVIKAKQRRKKERKHDNT